MRENHEIEHQSFAHVLAVGRHRRGFRPRPIVAHQAGACAGWFIENVRAWYPVGYRNILWGNIASKINMPAVARIYFASRDALVNTSADRLLTAKKTYTYAFCPMSEVEDNSRLTKRRQSLLSLSFLAVTTRIPCLWRQLTPALGVLLEYRDQIEKLIIRGASWRGQA